MAPMTIKGLKLCFTQEPVLPGPAYGPGIEWSTLLLLHAMSVRLDSWTVQNSGTMCPLDAPTLRILVVS